MAPVWMAGVMVPGIRAGLVTWARVLIPRNYVLLRGAVSYI